MSSAFDEMIDATATLEGMCAAGGAKKTKGKRKMNLSEILEQRENLKQLSNDLQYALLEVRARLEAFQEIADKIGQADLELSAAEFDALIKHGITLGAKIKTATSSIYTISGIRRDGFIATSPNGKVEIIGRYHLEYLDQIEVMK